VSENVIQKRER